MNEWNVMEVFDPAYFEEALQWDDDYAPMECPGCLGEINGWTKYAGHQIAPGFGMAVSFIKYDEMSKVNRPFMVCSWDTSKLSARVHYRAYVDKWRGHALWGQKAKPTETTDHRSTSVTEFGSTEPRPLGGASGSSATPAN